jgi:predicted nuclease of predicted toxin-antitoxin system
MKLLVDMNLSPRWAAGLQSLGFESIHWSQVGAATAPDDEVLRWCAVNGHVLFTHDLDFGAILAASKGRNPSVVQLRAENVLPEATLRRVAGALRQVEQDLARGALVTIEPHRHRVRLLPLMPDSDGSAGQT